MKELNQVLVKKILRINKPNLTSNMTILALLARWCQHAQWTRSSFIKSQKSAKKVDKEQKNPQEFTQPYLREALYHIPSQGCPSAFLNSDLLPILPGEQKGPTRTGVWGVAVEFRSLSLIKQTGSVVITTLNNRFDPIFGSWVVWHFTSNVRELHRTLLSFLCSEASQPLHEARPSSLHPLVSEEVSAVSQPRAGSFWELMLWYYKEGPWNPSLCFEKGVIRTMFTEVLGEDPWETRSFRTTVLCWYNWRWVQGAPSKLLSHL